VDGEIAFRPPYEREILVIALKEAPVFDSEEARALLETTRATVKRHGVRHERGAFHAVLCDFNRVLSSARAHE
jgi:hypothetical protein